MVPFRPSPPKRNTDLEPYPGEPREKIERLFLQRTFVLKLQFFPPFLGDFDDFDSAVVGEPRPQTLREPLPQLGVNREFPDGLFRRDRETFPAFDRADDPIGDAGANPLQTVFVQLTVQTGQGGLRLEIGGHQIPLVAVEERNAVVNEFVEIKSVLAEEFQAGGLAFEGNVDRAERLRVKVEVEGVGDVTRDGPAFSRKRKERGRAGKNFGELSESRKCGKLKGGSSK